MWKVEEDAASTLVCRQHRGDEMAATASDVCNHRKWSKVVCGHYRSHLPVRFGGHRRIKHFGSPGILCEIAPISLRQNFAGRWLACLCRVPKFQERRPVHWKSEH